MTDAADRRFGRAMARTGRAWAAASAAARHARAALHDAIIESTSHLASFDTAKRVAYWGGMRQEREAQAVEARRALDSATRQFQQRRFQRADELREFGLSPAETAKLWTHAELGRALRVAKNPHAAYELGVWGAMGFSDLATVARVRSDLRATAEAELARRQGVWHSAWLRDAETLVEQHLEWARKALRSGRPATHSLGIARQHASLLTPGHALLEDLCALELLDRSPAVSESSHQPPPSVEEPAPDADSEP